jgi:hypothetical protein
MVICQLWTGIIKHNKYWLLGLKCARRDFLALGPKENYLCPREEKSWPHLWKETEGVSGQKHFWWSQFAEHWTV